MLFWGLIVLIVVYTVMAIIHLSGRGSWMIHGYSRLSADEKDKYNKKKICKIEGIRCLLFDIGLIVVTIFHNSQSEIALKVVPWVVGITLCFNIAWSISNEIKYRSGKPG